MTYDPDQPDASTDPRVARRHRWAVRLLLPAVALLALTFMIHLPDVLELITLWATVMLALTICLLRLPWERWRNHD